MQREILKRKQDKYAITCPIDSSNLKENRSMLSQPGKIFTSGRYFHTLSRVLLFLCHWALGRAAFPIDSPPPPPPWFLFVMGVFLNMSGKTRNQILQPWVHISSVCATWSTLYLIVMLHIALSSSPPSLGGPLSMQDFRWHISRYLSGEKGQPWSPHLRLPQRWRSEGHGGPLALD